MRVCEFFDFAISCGIEADPRGKKQVQEFLKQEKKRFEKLSDKEKKFFDIQRLKNPYVDSRILFNPHNNEVKTILCGIDIEVGEVLLADALKKAGKKIDLIVAHHPAGYAYSNFFEVMDMQPEVHEQWGVPINIGEALIKERKSRVERNVLPRNHTRAQDAAKLLGIPFLNLHTPADNHVATFLTEKFKGKKLKVGDVLDELNSIEEYRWAKENFLPSPKILVGDKNNSCGKIVVDMTGGTEPSEEIFEKMANAGVGTVIGMHYSEKHIEKAKNSYINVIVAGHISSDTLGMNLLLDKIEAKFGKLQIFECSGFHRVRRKKQV